LPIYTPRPQRPNIPVIAVGNGQTPQDPRPPTHEVVVHQPQMPPSVTSGDPVPSGRPYTLEVIEPGIQNHKVEVYRSKDAQERIYQDTIPLDAGGFHLKVMGIRNPGYSH
jgi:hypothetical protein